MAGFSSIIGLLLQVVLVVIVARLVFAWWQRRNMTAPVYAAASPATGYGFRGLSGMMNGGNGPSAGEEHLITIAKSDYDAFERLLADIQGAYSAEDFSALRAKATPEMLSYFSEQLAGNANRGREGNTDYATVAINFAFKDSTVERATGRTVEGCELSEVTELWTFRRAREGNWLLSAIQQT